MKPRSALCKALIIIGYILVFWGLVPGLLLGLGWQIDGLFQLQWQTGIFAWSVSGLLLLVGGGILLWSVGQLWFQGKGLPISHLPPTEFVATGLYRWFRHPIYVGFTLAFAGLSIAIKSFGCFAFSTPLLGLAWWAYVRWLEEPALVERFGATYTRYQSQVGLWGPTPAIDHPFFTSNTPLSPKRRLLYAIAFAAIWLVWAWTYMAIGGFCVDRHTNTLFLPIDRILPFVPEAEFLYAFCYLTPLIPLFAIDTDSRLHRLICCFLLLNVCAFVCFLLFPVYRPRPSFEVHSAATWLLRWEYANDHPVNNFPSLHAAIAWLVFLSCRGRWKLLDFALLAIALGIGIAALLVKQHFVVDIVAGKTLSGLLWGFLAPYFPATSPQPLSPAEADR